MFESRQFIEATEGSKPSPTTVDIGTVMATITLPVLPMLVTATLYIISLTPAVDEIRRTIDDLNKPEDQLRIDLRRERLMREVKAELALVEAALQIGRFPQSDRIQVNGDRLPADALFAKMCSESQQQLVDVRASTHRVYLTALRNAGNKSGQGRYYDVVECPEEPVPAKLVEKNVVVLANSSVDRELREEALSHIRGRFDEWSTHVVILQRDTVYRHLDVAASLAIDDADRIRTNQNIQDQFLKAAYPLLPAVTQQPVVNK